MASRNIPIISFYSYKGGSGRSVCVANTAGYVAELLGASSETPLLLVDMDIDSAGLTNVLSNANEFAESGVNIQSLLREDLTLLSDIEIKKFKKGLVAVEKKVINESAAEGSVVLLGNTFEGRLESINTRTIHNLIKRLRSTDYNFCGILLDSASGRQPGAVMAHMVSDLVVYCCRMGYQHRIGTESEIKHYYKYVKEQGDPPPEIIVLPVAVPAPSNDETIVKLENRAKIDMIRFQKVSKVYVVNEGVPEVLSLKWHETVLRAKPEELLMQDEKSAVKVYQDLAKMIHDVLKKQAESLS